MSEYHELPKVVAELGRYLFLANHAKSKNERCQIIVEELQELWKKLNIPCQNQRSVKRKVDLVIGKYRKYQQRPTDEAHSTFFQLFNITNEFGSWLNIQDKRFYELQLSSNGDNGYSTERKASKILFIRRREEFLYMTCLSIRHLRLFLQCQTPRSHRQKTHH